MAIDTGIQWADSTLNIQMGCEGCELIKGENRKHPKCYAKIMVDRYGGKNSGFPKVFEKPEVFLDRLKLIARWPDLTGKEREKKPWLNGLPRVVFLNDMGDTFSKGMPPDWFADAVPYIQNSPHVFMLLTKWPARLAEFSKKFTLPGNIWPGTTVTDQNTAFRAYELNNNVVAGGVKWLSIEPMWGQIEFIPEVTTKIKLIIYGGESGSTNVSHFNCNWLYKQIQFCDQYKKKCFVKQLGSNPFLNSKALDLNDYSGGDWLEWPSQFQLREFPQPFGNYYK
jgi:protein gp37